MQVLEPGVCARYAPRMRDERTSLSADLTSALRSAVDAEGAESSAQRLIALEAEHREISDRRRRLHESIDIMASAPSLRHDAIPLLERYRVSERELSWRRQVVYREIGALRSRLPSQGRESGAGSSAQPS